MVAIPENIDVSVFELVRSMNALLCLIVVAKALKTAAPPSPFEAAAVDARIATSAATF
jgi:hypothetical protein